MSAPAWIAAVARAAAAVACSQIRTTRTLELLTDELDATPAQLPGEGRPPVCARPAAGLRTKAPCPR
ncbi:MAG TPA: hypothetical protein VHN80_14805 [Kineosporiaceae bacterium]|nr:hypothetical protein [Kineosporiaceae bacterium]